MWQDVYRTSLRQEPVRLLAQSDHGPQYSQRNEEGLLRITSLKLMIFSDILMRLVNW